MNLLQRLEQAGKARAEEKRSQGRPKSVDRVAIKFFKEKGYSHREIAKLACCSQSSVDKILAKGEKP